MNDNDPDLRPATNSNPLGERPRPATDAAVSNAAMVQKILQLPPAPFLEGGYVVRVAEIRGRRSGSVHRVPIAVVTMDGEQFLVSPRRPWVLNLASDPLCSLVSSESRVPYRAVTADADSGIRVLRLYLAQLRWAAEQFPFGPDDPDELIRERLEQVAVFRLIRVAGSSR